MPDNLTTVQLLTIPQSKFKLGDLVSYTIKFQTRSTTYFGKVVSRIWTNDSSNISYWEYLVENFVVFKNGSLSDFEGTDPVLESDLIPWNGFKKDCLTIPNSKIFQHR